MSKTNKNGGLKKNSNQPQNPKPFDITMNEKLLFKDKRNTHNVIPPIKLNNLKCVMKNWFIPIITKQRDVDDLLSNNESNNSYWGIEHKYPTPKLYIEHNEKGELSSVYVLINKGGTLHKVVSQKDYGVIKSRMELNDKGKLVPYGKCDLVPFNGEYIEYDVIRDKSWYKNDISFIKEKSTYVNGKKDGESIIYLKHHRNDSKKDFGIQKGYPYEFSNYHFELTTYVNGKKDGKYLHTKNRVCGNYINNKRVDEWEMMSETLYKILTDINGVSPSYFDCGVDESYRSVKVNYKNGELIGKYKNYNGWEGELNYGKFNGVVKEYEEEEYGDGGVPHRVINYDNGKKNGVELTFDGGGGSPTHYYNISLTDWVNGNRMREMKIGLYNQIMFPPMRRVFDSELTDNDITTINKYFKEFDKETFFDLYQIYSYTEYEYNSSGVRSIKKNYKTEWLDIKKEWKENDKYQYDWRTESRWNEMMINQFNYPHYTKRDRKDYNDEYWVEYKLNESQFLTNDDDGWLIESFVKDGKRYLVNGNYDNYEWVENDDSNPIVKDLKREVIKDRLEELKKRYEIQLENDKKLEIKLQKEREEYEREKKEEQKRKEEMEKEILKQKELEGVSLSSFPMD